MVGHDGWVALLAPSPTPHTVTLPLSPRAVTLQSPSSPAAHTRSLFFFFSLSYPNTATFLDYTSLSHWTAVSLPPARAPPSRRPPSLYNLSLLTVLQPSDFSTMPIPRVKSRVRFQGTKKAKHHNGKTAQRRPARTVYGDALDLTFVGDVRDNESLFAKKWVPSTDELGDALCSNLSSSLTASKAASIQRAVLDSPSSSACQHLEWLQGENNDPPAWLLYLAPIYRPIGDHLKATTPNAVADGEGGDDSGPPASLLATTAIHRQVDDHLEPQTSRAEVVERLGEDNQIPVPPPTLEEGPLLADHHNEPTLQPPAPSLSSVETCAIEDEYDDPPASLLVETRETFVEYIRTAARPSIEPLQLQKRRPTFLQRVVTLFAGRRRYSKPTEESPKAPDSSKVHQPSTAPAPFFHEFSPYYPPPPPRRAALPADTTPRRPIPRKNLPLSPLVIATHCPYRPIEENSKASLIEPEKEHRYTCTYGVVPDVFQPAEVQIGFLSSPPSNPVSPVSLISPTVAAPLLQSGSETPTLGI
jgi:hypothetical protein